MRPATCTSLGSRAPASTVLVTQSVCILLHFRFLFCLSCLLYGPKEFTRGTKILNLSGNKCLGSFLCWDRPGQRGHTNSGGPGQTCEPDATVTSVNVWADIPDGFAVSFGLIQEIQVAPGGYVPVNHKKFYSSTGCARASVNGGCSRFCFWSYPVVSAPSHICGCCFNLWVNLRSHSLTTERGWAWYSVKRD